MLLMDEAQFEDDKNKSLLHMRMMELKSRDKYHPAVKAYERYAIAANSNLIEWDIISGKYIQYFFIIKRIHS